MIMNEIKPFEILLIEDNPGDVFLMQISFKEGKAPIHLSVVRNGIEALDFLKKEGKYKKRRDYVPKQ